MYIFTFIQIGIESNDCSANPSVLSIITFAKSLWPVAAKFYRKFCCLSPRIIDGSQAIIKVGKHYIYFFLGISSASEFYMPTFRNTLNVPSS